MTQGKSMFATIACGAAPAAGAAAACIPLFYSVVRSLMVSLLSPLL